MDINHRYAGGWDDQSTSKTKAQNLSPAAESSGYFANIRGQIGCFLQVLFSI